MCYTQITFNGHSSYRKSVYILLKHLTYLFLLQNLQYFLNSYLDFTEELPYVYQTNMILHPTVVLNL